MCMHAERKQLSDSGENVVDPCRRSVEVGNGHPVAPAGDVPQQCVSCDVRQGLPRISGNIWSYYVSRQGGHQMLVLGRKPSERIRINDTTDIVVLAIRNGQVELGIERVPGVDTTAAGCDQTNIDPEA